MDAGTTFASRCGNPGLDADAGWQLVRQVLASPPFAKAPRMCGLLSFLMSRKLSGMEDSINEYAIGIEVFRRDARDFDTAVDPIVRVQMGRLRHRLAQYNTTCAAAAGQRIAIPAGSYVPLLEPCQDRPRARPVSIELAPLRTLSARDGGGRFAEGFEEELALQLFHRFQHAEAGPARYRLEASIRVEPRRARASVRLVDVQAARTVWMHRRDREGDLAIAQQEDLARAVCDDLQAYLAEGPAPGPAR